ncbi:hypothetical protein Tco_1079357 [Tanacetum coccineum]|uniref:Reverse transcriptase zinc-binding domain-containing protein n=1 Tax=Tanacetum coccineum TaxID=301880 RepID=A0ABQ5HRM4_9ASTR
MVKMVPHEAFACRCAEGDVVLRQSYKPESYASKTFWMWIFLWKETRLRELMSSPGAPSTPSYFAGHSTPPSYSSGPSTPPSYSSGPSTPTNYSLGSSRNGECSNCKHLRGKISVLKATMEMHMHPEQHTVNSAALFHEVLNEMEKLDLETIFRSPEKVSSLKAVFLVLNEEVCVRDKGCWDHIGLNWYFDWVRNPRGRSMGELEDCFSLVRDQAPNRDGTNMWKLVLEDSGFTYKGLKEMVDEKALGPRSQVEEMKLWMIVPQKVNVFMWRLKCGQIRIRILLDNIGMNLHYTLSPHCEEVIETIS